MSMASDIEPELRGSVPRRVKGDGGFGCGLFATGLVLSPWALRALDGKAGEVDAFFFGGMGAIVFVAYSFLAWKHRRLVLHGVAVRARIISKHIQTSKNTSTYHVCYAFFADGELVEGECQVSKELWGSIRAPREWTVNSASNSILTALYDPTAPTTNVLYAAAHCKAISSGDAIST